MNVYGTIFCKFQLKGFLGSEFQNRKHAYLGRLLASIPPPEKPHETIKCKTHPLEVLSTPHSLLNIPKTNVNCIDLKIS